MSDRLHQGGDENRRELGQLVAGCLLGALAMGVMGTVLGAFFLPTPERLGALFGAPGKLPAGWWPYSLLGLAVGSIAGFFRALAQIRRRRAMLEAAVTMGFSFVDSGNLELEEGLRGLIDQNQSFSLSNVLLKEVAGAQFYVADLKISSHSSENNSETRQTIAYFAASDLPFPEFTLRPQGRLLKVFSNLVWNTDINFDAYPEFSEQYHLSGSNPDAIRQLFTHAVLEHLTSQPGWQIQARENRLLMFRPRGQCSPAKLADFMNEALAAFSLFFDALQSCVDLSQTSAGGRNPTQSLASSDAAQPATGVLGRMMGLRFITQAEVDNFLAQPAPREVPARLKQQQSGGSLWFLWIWGLIFGGIGGSVMVAMIFAREWQGVAFSSLFPTIGFLVVFFATRNYLRGVRLLREGHVAEARIDSLEATQIWVNGQRRYRASIKFPAPGGDLRRTVSVYGPAVRKAEARLARQEPVRVLYLPDRPERFILADSLVTDARVEASPV